MILNAFLLCLGILLLYFGSEWMVRGAASLAISFHLRPIVVGLTIVAFATSAPELLVSFIAAVKGASGVSLGNIIGSNVANVGLVLGASTLLRPLAVDQDLVRRDIPFMIVFSAVFWLISLDGEIGRIDGLILLSGLALFLYLGIRSAGKGDRAGTEFGKGKNRNTARHLLLILVGITGLMVGADLIVRSAIFIARNLGFSELFIGLTIVAVGTSLPELATSMVAGARSQADLSIGNVVGSNVFNICMVMGMVGLLNPIAVDGKLMNFEFPSLLILSLLLFICCRTGYMIKRWEGILFLSLYVLFIALSYGRSL
jgi:cation:H+ antiporter